jgi:hypothetical protein
MTSSGWFGSALGTANASASLLASVRPTEVGITSVDPTDVGKNFGPHNPTLCGGFCVEPDVQLCRETADRGLVGDVVANRARRGAPSLRGQGSRRLRSGIPRLHSAVPDD